MKMLRSKKGLLAIMLTLVLTFGSCITVSAAENEFDLSQFELKEYTLVVDMKLSMDTYGCYVITSDSPIIYNSFYKQIIAYGPFTTYHRNHEYGFSEDVSNYLLETCSSADKLRMYTCSTPDILFSSHDILNEKGEIFFQRPEMPQLQLGEISPEMVIQEILAILPIVIVMMVGYLALRKGLSMLFNRLRMV